MSNGRSRRRVVFGLAAALGAVALGAAPALAGTSYPPEVLSLGAVCSEGPTLVVSVDGVMPNSTVHVKLDFQNVADAEFDETADALGNLTQLYALPLTAQTGQIFTVEISGLDYVPGNGQGEPFLQVIPINRLACPDDDEDDLPDTGANSFPIGKAALAVSLVGGILAVVAIRRRDDDQDDHRDEHLVDA